MVSWARSTSTLVRTACRDGIVGIRVILPAPGPGDSSASRDLTSQLDWPFHVRQMRLLRQGETGRRARGGTKGWSEEAQPGARPRGAGPAGRSANPTPRSRFPEALPRVLRGVQGGPRQVAGGDIRRGPGIPSRHQLEG